MKKFRLLSGFLAFLMVFSMLTVLPVAAAPADEDEEEPATTVDYLNDAFKTPQEKLDTMTPMVTSEDGRYTLYVDTYSGEVAYHDNIVNQTLFSNPYNLNDVSKGSSADIKAKLLSQVIVKYLDNAKESYYYSFTEAAEREQIQVKNIKNGVRVEYSIGREETRKLVPKMIEKSRFENLILANVEHDEFAWSKFDAFYTLKDPSDPNLSDRAKQEMMATFKITNKMAVYVFDPYAKDRELNMIEGFILEYCPTYTYDELDADHALTEYEGSDVAPAQFKMALEYYLEDGTLRVRFPVNGLRFDDTTYQLTSLQILPYFGCGSYEYDGYLFLPDGSGAITRFEDFAELSGKTVTGKVYGQDYAFYQISGEHQETVRLPVFGVVENVLVETAKMDMVPVDPYYDDAGNLIEEELQMVKDTFVEDRGYFAVIEEGEAITSITAETGGRTSSFDTVYTTLVPRQRDSYDIADAVSGAGSAMWTVVSKRKYTGNYTMRYTMLNYGEYAEEAGLSEGDYYETSYMGMLNVARDYYQKRGILTRLEKDDVKEDIPLYIESFGTAQITEKILSFPVTVHTPLTTFDDLKTMYERLKEEGITNVNYKLTGFFNGGLWHTVPYKVEVEENVGGAEGFKDFISYAKDNDIGVYPDFDFVWADAAENDFFSGLNKRKHLIKTMNTKYARLREYDPLYQEYRGSYNLAISPAYFSYYYDEFTKNFSKLEPIGISVSTLGQYLNTDFDKKDPYHREDNKEYTVELFKQIKEEYGNVMTEGGNFYAVPYVTDILNVPLDSSEYLNTSETIPFLGMLLHGHVNFTGMAMNNAGDMDYQILKAIENGASCYFQLSYQNTEKLKSNTDFAKYYSISFDIWFDDLVRVYNTLNDAISDLQTKLIVDHEFITGERVLSAEEQAELDAEIALLIAELEEQRAQEEARREELAAQEELDSELGLDDEDEEDGEKTEDGEEDTEEKDDEKEEDEDASDDEEASEDDEMTDEEREAAFEEQIEKAKERLESRNIIDNGKIVKVTYEGGTYFILNYNNFSVTVDGEEVPALSFIRKG